VETGIAPLHVGTEFEKVDGKIAVKEQLLALHARLTQAIDDLLETLADDPSSYARKVEQVGLIFRNMQYLINILRPLQAAQTLKDVLRHKIREKQDCLEALSA
jgi:hypothetical protein